MNANKHLFAFYYPSLESSVKPQVVVDEHLIQRISVVVRLKEGEQLILFNGTHVAHAEIVSITKKALRVAIQQLDIVEQLQPSIIWLLPILEREAFEQSLYILSVLGITSIQPLITLKSRRAWGSEKDYDRARKITVAGCEQAKQFVLPELLPVQELSTLNFSQLPLHRLFFDPQGAPFFDALQKLRDTSSTHNICCLVGPEGDLTLQEKELVGNAGFSFQALTPTILKAVDAVTIVAGMLRTAIKR